MTPQRKIEILTLLKNRIEKDVLKYGLCDVIKHLSLVGNINSWESAELADEFMTWTKSTPYRVKYESKYAAPPGEAQPRLDYLNKRIEELQKELANAQ